MSMMAFMRVAISLLQPAKTVLEGSLVLWFIDYFLQFGVTPSAISCLQSLRSFRYGARFRKQVKPTQIGKSAGSSVSTSYIGQS